MHTSQQQSTLSATDLNTSKLVELLQQYAVEHLTTYHQLVAQDFGSATRIVTTDYEALYAYKHGDYQNCLQLSKQKLPMLFTAVNMHCSFYAFPQFIQLLDDEIASLIALTLIANPECSYSGDDVCICGLTLSLYLITQCQIKLRHSVTSLAQTLDCIILAQLKVPTVWPLSQLTLKLTKQKVVMYSKRQLYQDLQMVPRSRITADGPECFQLNTGWLMRAGLDHFYFW